MLLSNAVASLVQGLRKRVIRIGRVYQGQSIALIALCRHLVEKDISPTNNGLQAILRLADAALLAAENAGKNETPEANDAFTTIRDQLERYPMTTPDSQKLFNVLMGAGLKDRTATATIQSVGKKSSPAPKAVPRKKINFVILRSLGGDEIPDIVHEEVDNPTTVPQILWFFSRRKGEGRITLKENPHFYLKIPQMGSKSEFDGKGFHRDPLLQIGPGLEKNDTVYVLLDRSSRLYLDVAEPRVFGNLWHPNKKIILKDICGILDSEDNIRPSLEKEMVDFWYRPSPTDGSQSPVRSFDSEDDHQIIETPFGHWYTLVHAAVKSRDIDLMIRAKKSRPNPPQDWKLLPPPERPRVAPQKSREHSQKRHRATTAGSYAAADQHSSSPSDATSKPSTTSINTTFNISSTTLVVTAATSNCHLLSHDGTRDVKRGDSDTPSHPLTSIPRKGRGTEPSRSSIPSTPQTFTPALSTHTSGRKSTVVGQMSQTDSRPASPQPLIPTSPPEPPLTRDSQSTLVLSPSPNILSKRLLSTPPPPTPSPHHAAPKRRSAPHANSRFQSLRNFYEGMGMGQGSKPQLRAS